MMQGVPSRHGIAHDHFPTIDQIHRMGHGTRLLLLLQRSHLPWIHLWCEEHEARAIEWCLVERTIRALLEERDAADAADADDSVDGGALLEEFGNAAFKRVGGRTTAKGVGVENAKVGVVIGPVHTPVVLQVFLSRSSRTASTGSSVRSKAPKASHFWV